VVDVQSQDCVTEVTCTAMLAPHDSSYHYETAKVFQEEVLRGTWDKTILICSI
jgi:hypothetical protein